jgi:protoporphyrinogen oxidase
MLKRLLPGGTGSGAGNTKGIFYYPKRGFGQISDRLAEAAQAAGAQLMLGAKVCEVKLGAAPELIVEEEGISKHLSADFIYSTIPLTAQARLIQPTAPARVLAAADSLEFRAMLLVYLAVEQPRFTEFDAHYFPESGLPFTRVSEPKNYAALKEPAERTVLCAEIPCAPEDAVWSQSDEELGRTVADGLSLAGLPLSAAVSQVQVERIRFAYPVYRSGYEAFFDCIDGWLGEQPGLLHFGRQGLYAHDNTHHALYMAQAAARCLRDDGQIDRKEWQRERAVFATHVVED